MLHKTLAIAPRTTNANPQARSVVVKSISITRLHSVPQWLSNQPSKRWSCSLTENSPKRLPKKSPKETKPTELREIRADVIGEFTKKSHFKLQAAGTAAPRRLQVHPAVLRPGAMRRQRPARAGPWTGGIVLRAELGTARCCRTRQPRAGSQGAGIPSCRRPIMLDCRQLPCLAEISLQLTSQ